MFPTVSITFFKSREAAAILAQTCAEDDECTVYEVQEGKRGGTEFVVAVYDAGDAETGRVFLGFL